MKRILFAVVLLLALLAVSACRETDIAWYARTTLGVADTAGSVFNVAYQARCSAGQATPEQCVRWESIYVKFTATLNAARFALDEYEKVKGKPAEEKLMILLTDMNVIVAQIRELINAWGNKAALDELERLEAQLARISCFASTRS